MKQRLVAEAFPIAACADHNLVLPGSWYHKPVWRYLHTQRPHAKDLGFTDE